MAYLTNVMKASYPTPKQANREIVEAFANCFVALIGHYGDHLEREAGFDDRLILNEKNFLAAAPIQYQPFLIDLMLTQQFCVFIDQRCEAKSKGSKGMHNGSLFEQLLKRHDVKHILALSQQTESKVQRSRYFKKKEKKRFKRGGSASADVGGTGGGSRTMKKNAPLSAVVSPTNGARRRASTSTLDVMNATAGTDGPAAPATYQEHIVLIISQMEASCRGLEDYLGAQRGKDRVTASELDGATDRFRDLVRSVLGQEVVTVLRGASETPDTLWMASPEAIPAGRNANPKMMARFQDVRDLLEEGGVLGKSVSRLDEKQSIQNVSAIHGIANLKQHWAYGQLRHYFGPPHACLSAFRHPPLAMSAMYYSVPNLIGW